MKHINRIRAIAHQTCRLTLAAATAAALAACAATADTPAGGASQPEGAGFPNVSSAWLKNGTFVDVEQLRRIGRGMNKNQVRELIGQPHFSEGLFGVTEWNYLFNFRTGQGDEYVSCQYRVKFNGDLSDVMQWKERACADHLKPRVSEVLRPVTLAPTERFRLGADALFPFDKSGPADMLPAGRRELDTLASELKGRYRRIDSIVVVGHTDRLGSDGYNQQLSVARAATVRDHLTAQGLPAQSIRAFGVGKTQPVAQCADSLPRTELIACLQPSRRVELEVQGER